MHVYKVINKQNGRWYITSSISEIAIYDNSNFSIQILEECDETIIDAKLDFWIRVTTKQEDSISYNTAEPRVTLHTLPLELQEDLTQSISENWAGYEDLVNEETNQKRRDAWDRKSTQYKLEHAERTRQVHKNKPKSEEHKKKIAASKENISNDTRRKMSESHKGSKHSQSTIEKLKKIAKEKNTPKCSESEIAEIIKLKISGVSAKKLSKQFGVSENTIYRYCRKSSK